MKTCSNLCFILIMGVFAAPLFSQSSASKLDQLSLMQKMAGTWMANDSSSRMTLTLHGKGGEADCFMYSKEKEAFYIKQLWLYNATEDNITIVQLSGNERLECWKMKFTSPTTMVGKFYNFEDPSRILQEWTMEFVTPDKLVETMISDPKKFTMTSFRVK